MLMIDSILNKYKNSFKLGVKIIISTYELISLYKEKILKNKFGVYYNKSKQHVNSWSTMFNLQALILNNENIFNQSNQRIELLV